MLAFQMGLLHGFSPIYLRGNQILQVFRSTLTIYGQLWSMLLQPGELKPPYGEGAPENCHLKPDRMSAILFLPICAPIIILILYGASFEYLANLPAADDIHEETKLGRVKPIAGWQILLPSMNKLPGANKLPRRNKLQGANKLEIWNLEKTDFLCEILHTFAFAL